MLERIVIIALSVLAVWSTMWEGAILEFVSKFFAEILDDTDWEKWEKPIYSCPICMVPYYGTGFFLIFWPNSTFLEWVITIVGAMGFNVIATKLFPED